MKQQPVDPVPDQEKVRKGTDLVKGGWLGTLRKTTGISRNYLAGLLGSHGAQVGRWETGQVQWVHFRTAVKVAELHEGFTIVDDWLQSEQMVWGDIVPLRIAASRLGMSTPFLRIRLSDRGIAPIELGTFGEWITRNEAAACRR